MITLKTISFYEKWFAKQDKKVRVQVATALNKVMVGNTSKCKFVRDGVYEIKIHFGKGVRIYYIKETNTLYLLVGSGADKKRQAEDIKKAVAISKYIEKIGNNI